MLLCVVVVVLFCKLIDVCSALYERQTDFHNKKVGDHLVLLTPRIGVWLIINMYITHRVSGPVVGICLLGAWNYIIILISLQYRSMKWKEESNSKWKYDRLYIDNNIYFYYTFSLVKQGMFKTSKEWSETLCFFGTNTIVPF